jgi:hypothetical protein
MKPLIALSLLAVATFAQAPMSPEDETKMKDAAHEFIKDHLKAPATAQFSKETVCQRVGKADFDEADGTGPTPECKPVVVDDKGKLGGVYRVAVDAQNSYGALIRTKYIVLFDFKDGKWGFFDTADMVQSQFESCIVLGAYGKSGPEKRTAEAACKKQFPHAR